MEATMTHSDMVGLALKCGEGKYWRITGYDPRRGFYLESFLNPTVVKCISERAIGRTFHLKNEMKFQHSSSLRPVLYETIWRAFDADGEPHYKMSLTSKDEKAAVMRAVNQGIDSHLEACYAPHLGDSYKPGKRTAGNEVLCTTLECKVSRRSLPTLIRRLSEQTYGEDDEAEGLADSILATLGIDDSGHWVGREALGLE